MKHLFDQVSVKCSELITQTYSTSFSLGIRFLAKRFREPIHSIYGFVRIADEIVDSFHGFDKDYLLKEFKNQTFDAINYGISTNPVLNNFQKYVYTYDIPFSLIDGFLTSMEMDLNKTKYNQEQIKNYIYGSAEVVGLMCLKVFVEGDEELYKKLEYNASKLGAAFQKINFLRDLKNDYYELGRQYFPSINAAGFNDELKISIEKDIEFDFNEGYKGIKMLPKESRFGVYIAYVYYHRLFLKIRKTSANNIMHARIRIPNFRKYLLFFTSYIKHSFNLL